MLQRLMLLHKSIFAMLVKHAPANLLSLQHMHRYATMITLRARTCPPCALQWSPMRHPAPTSPCRHLHHSITRLYVLHTGPSDTSIDTSKGALLRSVRHPVCRPLHARASQQQQHQQCAADMCLTLCFPHSSTP